MASISERIGLESQKNDDGTYNPSPAAMQFAVQHHTHYTPVDYPNPYSGDQKVLVLCTEDGQLHCTNGKVFHTGNHPVELFVVILHLEKAGFTVELSTPTGQPVPIETWATPDQDQIVANAMARYRDQLAKPLSMEDLVTSLDDQSPYAAAYIPGGHGAVLSVPTSTAAKSVLEWFIAHDRYIITICHGPAGLLSLALDSDPKEFPLQGYKLAAFPDSSDKLMVGFGYLPGPMPYFFNARLEELGMDVVSHVPVGGTHVDRILISGDSPFASDKLGKLAAEHLLEWANTPAKANA